MKFDVVVGNPPYQENQEGQEQRKRKGLSHNLWSKFWWLSFQIVESNGNIVLLTPTTWMSPSKDINGSFRVDGKTRLWEVFESYETVSRVTGVDRHFPVELRGTSYGWVNVHVSQKNAGLRFVEGYDTSLGFMPRSGNANVEKIKKLIDRTHNFETYFKIDQINSPDLRVCIPISKYIKKDEDVQVLRGNEMPIGKYSTDLMFLYVHVNTEAEAEAVRSRILEAAEILNVDCRWSGFASRKMLKLLRYQP
jgi:hypothetical protein